MPIIELTSPRLRLRAWREEDLPAFAALNADPEVMRYFPAPLDPAQSDALAVRLRAHFEAHGFGQWVLERHEQPGLIGILGLLHVGFEAAFTPAVEIGWRLGREFWHQGFALEAGQAVMRCAFHELQLDEVLAFTVPANRPSRILMERLTMQHDPYGDFDHPRLAPGHPLRAHVLYRLTRTGWENDHGR